MWTRTGPATFAPPGSESRHRTESSLVSEAELVAPTPSRSPENRGRKNTQAGRQRSGVWSCSKLKLTEGRLGGTCCVQDLPSAAQLAVKCRFELVLTMEAGRRLNLAVRGRSCFRRTSLLPPFRLVHPECEFGRSAKHAQRVGCNRKRGAVKSILPLK